MLCISFLQGLIPMQEFFQIERKVCRWVIDQWLWGER